MPASPRIPFSADNDHARPANPTARRIGGYLLWHDPAGAPPDAKAHEDLRGLAVDHAGGALCIGQIGPRVGPGPWTVVAPDVTPPWMAASEAVQVSARDGLGRLIAELLGHIHQGPGPMDADDALAMLDAAFLLAHQAASGRPAAPEPEPVAREPRAEALRMIEDRLLDRNLGVPMLTSALGLSRASLYRMFQDLGGVNAYIRQRRLERARRVLEQRVGGRPTLAEVAQFHGFANESHFSRAYRAAFGMAPGGRAGGKASPSRSDA